MLKIPVITLRERIILYTTIAVVIFSIGFNLLIAPALTKNERLNKEININRIKLKKYSKLLSQKEYIQAKYNKFASGLKVSKESGDILVGALSELGNLAKDAGIRIVDIRPHATSTSLTLYKEALVDLRTDGTMENYLKFIYNIENSLSLLRIRRLQLTAKPNSSTLEGNFLISQLSALE